MPTAVFLRLTNSRVVDENVSFIFIEPKKMTITINTDKKSQPIVTGSETNKVYDTLLSLQKALLEKYGGADNVGNLNAEQKKNLSQEFILLDTSFMLARSKSVVTAFFIQQYYRYFSDDRLLNYYNEMGDTLQKSIYGQQLSDLLSHKLKTAVEQYAPDFTKTDINGKTISLHDFKGKYVLLDFWASWCAPCRAEIPHIKELYKKYHDKGLEIIGIADDDINPTAWRKAVKKDGTNIWYQVLRGLDTAKYNRGIKNPNDLDILYPNNGGIPFKILISPDMKILFRCNSDQNEELDKLLQNIFKEK